MTIYTLFIFISILYVLFLSAQIIFGSKTATDKVFFPAFVFSIIGIYSLVFFDQLRLLPISPEKLEILYYFFLTFASFFFLSLSLSQEKFSHRNKTVFYVSLVNTFLIACLLGLSYSDASYSLIPKGYSVLHAFFSCHLYFLAALYAIHRKARMLAEIQQARLSAYFMATLVFFLIGLWNIYVLKSGSYHLMIFILLPFAWMIRQLIAAKKVIVIENFLKALILKAACIAFYFYSYLFLKLYLIVSNEPLEEKSYFFFTGFLMFTFLTYPSVEKFFNERLKKILFRPLVNYHLLFQSFSSVILAMVDVNKITDMAVKMFYDAYGIERVAMFMFRPETKTYELQTSIGAKLPEISLTEKHPLIKFVMTYFRVVAKKEAKGMRDRRAIEFFRQTKTEVFIPLEAKRSLIGFLILGRKTDGSDYSQDDMEIFNVMEGQISVALNNALFFETERESFELMAQRNKMDAVIALSGGINHEINNPLSIISMKSQNFLRKMEQNKFASKEEALQSAAEVIESNLKNAGRAHQITKRLGNFAKPTRDRAEYESLELYEYVQESLDLIGRKGLEADRVEVQIDIPVTGCQIVSDKTQLQQILFNLINNAYHAIGKDGKVTLRTEPAPDDEIKLTIEDNGSGIKKEELKKIWQPFFTTKPKQPTAENKFTGTGLGLALVRRYIEHSGGRIEVESQENVGTKFFLYFKKSKVD